MVKKISAIVLAALSTLTGCNAMTEFDFLASECCPEGYPMEIVTGCFISNDGGGELMIPSGKILNGPWGQSVSTHIVGPTLKPVPSRLEILFFSYAEDKFYSGAFDLPYQKLLGLFQQASNSHETNKRVWFSKILVGVNPGG